MLNNIYHEIKHGSLIKNVFVLATGTAGAQALTFMFAPLITRLYGPEAYGVLGVFISFLMVFGPIAAMTYPLAIVLPKQSSVSHVVERLSFYLCTTISLAVFVLLFFLSDFFRESERLNVLYQYTWLLPLAILFYGIFQIYEQRCIRLNQFKSIAASAFSKALVVGGLQVLIGYYNPDAAILVAAFSFGYLIQALVLKYTLGDSNIRRKNTKVRDIKRVAKIYSDFPKYRAPQMLLSGMTTGIPAIFIASHFDLATAGMYSLALSVISVPLMLFGNSITNVFYPKVSKAIQNNENVQGLIVKATIFIFAISLIPMVVIVPFGPPLFEIVFGDGWALAGEFAQWMSLMMMFGLLARPAIAAFPALKIQRSILVFDIFGFVIKLLALFIPYIIFNNAIIVVACFSLVNVALYLCLIFIVYRKIKVSTNHKKMATPEYKTTS